MKLIRLTHANHGTFLYVVAEQVAAWYVSPAHKCTHVVATGGAIVPAKESLDEVARLINQTPKEGEDNGIQESS